MGLEPAGLCYAQPLKNGIFTACKYSFVMSRLYNIYLSIKDLEILAEFCLSQILHLCTQKSVCATNFGLLGEMALIFLYNVHREHSLLKLKIKKLSPKFNMKNIKTRV